MKLRSTTTSPKNSSVSYHTCLLCKDSICMTFSFLSTRDLVHNIQLVCKYWQNILFCNPFPWKSTIFTSRTPTRYAPIVSKFCTSVHPWQENPFGKPLFHTTSNSESAPILIHCANTLQEIIGDCKNWPSHKLVFPQVLSLKLHGYTWCKSIESIAAQCPKHEQLKLVGTFMKSSQFSLLSNLTRLNVQFNDVEFVTKVKFPNLKKLTVKEHSFGFLELLQAPVPNCRKMKLNCKQGIEKLAKFDLNVLFPSLEIGSFGNFDSNLAVPAVRNCPNLTTLRIKYGNVELSNVTPMLSVHNLSLNLTNDSLSCEQIHAVFPNIARLCLKTIGCKFATLSEYLQFFKKQNLNGKINVVLAHAPITRIEYPSMFIHPLKIELQDCRMKSKWKMVAIAAILTGKMANLYKLTARIFQCHHEQAIKYSTITVHLVLQEKLVDNVPQAVVNEWKAKYDELDIYTLAKFSNKGLDIWNYENIYFFV